MNRNVKNPKKSHINDIYSADHKCLEKSTGKPSVHVPFPCMDDGPKKHTYILTHSLVVTMVTAWKMCIKSFVLKSNLTDLINLVVSNMYQLLFWFYLMFQRKKVLASTPH